VFPAGLHEGVIFWDIEAHIWSVGSQLQGYKYREARDSSPGPALVLGASNVSSIAATDVLSKLFGENRPVVCMLPPRLAPLLPVFKEAFYPLIRDRHLQIVCGGAETGQKLLAMPEFETVHLTGSKETFQKICGQNTFPGRTFTAELGCVTPAVIVPGPWTQEQLEYQARHIASLLVINGGYNCVTPQILVLSKSWPHKNAFLGALRRELKKQELRDDNFAGAADRRESFRREYPDSETYGPRTLVKLDRDEETRLFREEAFCGMLGWVELEADRPEQFMKQAAEFCNRRLWGDLSCLVLIDQRTRQVYERAVAQTLAALEYGTVGLNVYAGLAFASSVTPWGSYLNGKADTGNGWVHNTYFFDRPEKTVMEGSFIPITPKPWIKPFPNLHKVGPALFELDLEPTAPAFAKFVRAFGGSAWKLFRGRSTR
jgi:acyl-CoA reductase-like NAD-dependent aldehyde dehydrogenase